MTILWIVYILGCFMAYGRLMGMCYQLNQTTMGVNWRDTLTLAISVFVVLFSWMGFFIGVLSFFEGKDMYFFKLHCNVPKHRRKWK